jgi:hypothetical protein
VEFGVAKLRGKGTAFARRPNAALLPGACSARLFPLRLCVGYFPQDKRIGFFYHEIPARSQGFRKKLTTKSKKSKNEHIYPHFLKTSTSSTLWLNFFFAFPL